MGVAGKNMTKISKVLVIGSGRIIIGWVGESILIVDEVADLTIAIGRINGQLGLSRRQRND